MSIPAIENLATTSPTLGKNSSPDALRQAAQQFEAILLMQLTSAMNSTGDAGEDSLFGNDGGSDLAKKMFSEQMATTMAQSGGIGLADIIMEKFGATPTKNGAGKIKNLSDAIAAIKDVKENDGASKADSLESPPAPLMMDGKLYNSTRPRIVPESALSENKNISINSASLMPKTSERVEFQIPVVGRISSDFGARFHPVDRKMKFHAGIDIAVPKGTQIGAAAEGVVKFAGWKGGYGYTVIIEHPNGTETLYGHNQKLLVEKGQSIGAGEPISLSGSTGKSTGPHLHFEVRQNGRAVNPDKFLSNVLPKKADR
jgi:murein DD-endopeptidase MepM/ murein hydrolase activator NlpD